MQHHRTQARVSRTASLLVVGIPPFSVCVCVCVCVVCVCVGDGTASLLVVGIPPFSSSGAIQRDVPIRRDMNLPPPAWPSVSRDRRRDCQSGHRRDAAIEPAGACIATYGGARAVVCAWGEGKVVVVVVVGIGAGPLLGEAEVGDFAPQAAVDAA